MDIINVFRKDTPNIGDIYCSPSLYFTNIAKVVDILQIASSTPYDYRIENPVILGGGGLLNCGFFKAPLNKLLLSCSKIVGWGVGTNDKWGNPINYSQGASFSLLGVRDWNTDNLWTPCASVMHPAFKKEYPPPSMERVYYYHADKIYNKHPYITNSNISFEDVMAHLSSGETVVTNSYHGVLWALLLQKRVVVPMDERYINNKFQGMKHPPAFCDIEEMKKAQGIAHTGILDEYIEASLKFADRVSNIFDIEIKPL